MNPFDPFSPATKSAFVGQRTPLKRAMKALKQPKSPVLLIGPPRMGTTSIVLEATRRSQRDGLVVARADVTTASNLVDVANRLLREVSEGVRSSANERTVQWLVEQVGLHGAVGKGENGGVALLDHAARGLPGPAQGQMLNATLAALGALEAAGGPRIAIILEGVEHLPRIGGPQALWQLRVGLTEPDPIRAVLTAATDDMAVEAARSDGPFFGWATAIPVESIKRKRLSRWVREAVEGSGARIRKAALREIIDAGGDRTGDVVRVAATTLSAVQRTNGRGKVSRATVQAAVEQIVRESSGWFTADWRALTSRQQNLVRALAAGEEKPFAAAVRRHYDLRSSAAVARSLELLMQKGLVRRTDVGYALDNPFFRRWVQRSALHDVGNVPPH